MVSKFTQLDDLLVKDVPPKRDEHPRRAEQVFPFEQLARLRNLQEHYEPPEPKAFKPRVDPSSWLADEAHRDQFVLRYSEPHPSGKLVMMRLFWRGEGPRSMICSVSSCIKNLKSK